MSLLARNRVLLFLSLALFGAAAAVTAAVLTPAGLVRARSVAWGPEAQPRSGEIVGYASDRLGGECGLARVVGGEVRQRRALPGCHAYQAPEVVRFGGHSWVVWEHADDEVAISTLGPELTLAHTLHMPRPRTARGVLLPRTSVGVSADRLAVRYLRDQIVTVGADLSPWPGGVLEVASARIGPRGAIVVSGVLGLLALYFAVAGWTLAQPSLLRRRARAGRCLTLRLPERGASIVVGDRPVELELERAWVFGVDRAELGGSEVTLVLRTATSAGEPYRERDRLRALQVWPGTLRDALDRARALREGTLALAVLASSVMLLGMNAYLVW